MNMGQTFPTEADRAQEPSAESSGEDRERTRDDSALLDELEALLEEAERSAKLSANPQALN